MPGSGPVLTRPPCLTPVHSVEMQRQTYDRRTKQQKVEPAVELLESLNRGLLGGGRGGGGGGSGGSAGGSGG